MTPPVAEITERPRVSDRTDEASEHVGHAPETGLRRPRKFPYKPRRKRFVRMPSEADRFVFDEERDQLYLELLHKHRFATGWHFAALLPGSKQNIKRRLRPLYDHGYIDKPWQRRTRQQGGSSEVAYGMGDAGARWCRAQGWPMPRSSWRDKNREIKTRNLDHQLWITDFMVSLEYSCRQRADAVVLREADDILAEADPKYLPKKNPRNFGKVPDGMFALRRTRDGKTFPFFHETDRAKMPNKRSDFSRTDFYSKLVFFYDCWTSWSLWQRSKGREGSPPPYGFVHFGIATVTTSLERARGMSESVREITGGRGGGAGLFLFTDHTTLLEYRYNLLHMPWLDGNGEIKTLAEWIGM